MEGGGTLEFYPSSQISEAKIALTQHPQMLQELNEWEERQRIRELLMSCQCECKPVASKPQQIPENE